MVAPIILALALAGIVPGDWVTADRSALVRLAPCGPRLCGTIVRILARGPDVPSTDLNNPDPALRSHPLVGLTVLKDFTPAKDGWTGGYAYDPKTGRSYRARLSRGVGDSLTVTGCILIICKSQYWTRAR
jgi:uncharacterized protein (DUF2147 family)